MRAYYFDNLPGDQRLPHDLQPSQPVPTSNLATLGLRHWTIPVEPGYEAEIDRIAAENGYKNRDQINVTREGLGDLYESKIRGFFEEHLHEDEEIRYILSGSGYFDIRETPSEKWIRIAVEKGDLLVLPAGVYHRFTLDTNDQVLALRLFKDEPKWVPHNRSEVTDINPYRQEYLHNIGIATR